MSGSGAGCRVWGVWCRVQGAGCGVSGVGCRVWGVWCRVQGVAAVPLDGAVSEGIARRAINPEQRHNLARLTTPQV